MICTFLFPQTKKLSVPQKPFKIRLYVATVLAVLNPKNCFNTRLWFLFPFPVLRSLSSTFVFRRYLFAYYFNFLGCYEISFWWYYVVLLIVQNVIQPYQKNPKNKRNINLNINVVVVRYIYIFFVYGFSSLKIKNQKKSTKKKNDEMKGATKIMPIAIYLYISIYTIILLSFLFCFNFFCILFSFVSFLRWLYFSIKKTFSIF